MTFASGGTIGRSADNDWVLPDPQRYVSAHHARIYQRGGDYVLEDVSTNGVYLNDEEQPLAKLGPCRLCNGDLLRIGDYQLVVAIDESAAVIPFASPAGTPAAAPQGLAGGPGGNDGAIAPLLAALPPPTAGPAAGGAEPARPAAAVPVPPAAQARTAETGTDVPVPTKIDVLQSIARAAQTDLGAQLNLDELLMTDGAVGSGERLRPVDAYGQAVPVAAPRPRASAAQERAARRMERLGRAAVERERGPRPESLPALYDVQSGLLVFCRGAGIDAEQLPPDSQTRLLHLVGQLLRESLLGLKDLERLRHEMHNRYRITLTKDPEDTRPSLEGSSIEELLQELLCGHESRRIDAVQWLREAIDGTKRHERATLEALRAAFLEFLGRLEPAELESRFQRAPRRKAGNGGEQYWALFGEFYRNLMQMPPDHLPTPFLEAFAAAYARAILAPREPPAD